VSLVAVQAFLAGPTVVADTEKGLREAGKDGYELFVLWTGHIDLDKFVVDHVYVPQQQAFKLDDGLCVQVDASELHRLNMWLFKEKQLLGVQVHTHPRRAFHSETDDTYPIVTILGGVSVVVPNFCVGGFASPGTVVYRLSEEGWQELDPGSACSLLPSLSRP
jgi:hypothetical protein